MDNTKVKVAVLNYLKQRGNLCDINQLRAALEKFEKMWVLPMDLLNALSELVSEREVTVMEAISKGDPDRYRLSKTAKLAYIILGFMENNRGLCSRTSIFDGVSDFVTPLTWKEFYDAFEFLMDKKLVEKSLGGRLCTGGGSMISYKAVA